MGFVFCISINKKIFALVITDVLFVECEPEDQLLTGRWSGHLTPMNHPKMQSPVAYQVNYKGDTLQIDIIGQDSSVIPAKDILFTEDTLFFIFNEPEEKVVLDRALAKNKAHNLAVKA